MLRLYDNQEKLIKIVHSDSIKVLRQKQSLSDQYVSDYLTVELLTIDEQILKDVEYMAIPYRDDPRKYHLYYLATDSLERNNLVLEGVQSGIEELRKHPIYDQRSYGLSLTTTVEKILEGTNWQLGFMGEFQDVQTNFYYMSAFDALKKACANVGAEMQFFVEVTPTGIGARYIDFKQKIGKASGKRVVYGHNALKILKETDKTNLYTAVIPRGKGLSLNGDEPFVEYNKDYNGALVKEVRVAEDGTVAVDFFKSGETETSPKWITREKEQKTVAYIEIQADGSTKVHKVNRNSSGDGYTRKLGIDSVRWKKPLDKPLHQKYLEDKEATKLYGVKDHRGYNRPKFAFIDFNDVTDPFELIELGYQSLMEMNRPALTMKTDSLYLSDTGIGDTVRVVRPDKNFDYQTRVFEITWDRLTNATNDLKLGDKSMTNDSVKRISSIVSDAVGELNGRISDVVRSLPSAGGFNTNYRTEERPANPKINDLWFKPDPEREGEFIILTWNGEVWEKLMSKDFGKEIEAKLKEHEDKLSEVNQSITQTDQETQEKLDNFKKQLEALDLPDEDITRTLEDLERKLDRTSTKSDFALELIGSDGIKRYNKNILDGEYKRTVTLKEETTDLVASGGFKKGQTYTISFEALCQLLERHKVNLKMTLPEFLKGKAIGHYNASIEHESNKLSGYKRQDQSGDSYVLAYEGNNTLTISGNWYKTQKHNLTVTGDITKPITLEYRDGLEDNLTDDLTINWATDNEVKFESSL